MIPYRIVIAAAVLVSAFPIPESRTPIAIGVDSANPAPVQVAPVGGAHASTLHGSVHLDAFHVNVGEELVVDGDLELIVETSALVEGTIRVTRDPKVTSVDAPNLILRAGQSISVTGSILGAAGGPVPAPGAHGGNGSSITLHAPIVWIDGAVRGGDGGLGGKAIGDSQVNTTGKGGAVDMYGYYVTHRPVAEQPHSCKEATWGAIGGCGNPGGHAIAWGPLPEHLSFRALEASDPTPASKRSESDHAAAALAIECPAGTVGTPGGPSTGGTGANGLAGQNGSPAAPNGQPGTNGAQGAEGVGGNGGNGSNGADCCPEHGAAGGTGGTGGAGTGGDGGKGGDGGNGHAPNGAGGNGGSGGSGGLGKGGNGGNGGNGGAKHGGGGSGGVSQQGTPGNPGTGGAGGTGTPAGTNGPTGGGGGAASGNSGNAGNVGGICPQQH